MLNGKQSMAFRLVEKGFDVWVNNSRGTKYSLEHKYIDVKREPERYYDFSFHELGIYDMPALFKFVAKNTGFKKVSCVGHG